MDADQHLMDSFLIKDSWRIFRILAEFVDGFEVMASLGKAVSIFGSARSKPNSAEYELAVLVAQKIGQQGFSIITGGGPGVMEAANKGAQLAKSKSCGLTIALPFEAGVNPFVDRNYHVHFRYFFIRKVMFVRYAHAFVALPGGFGTLDELFEALTLIQTQKIRSFPIYLIGKEYWTGLLNWLTAVPLAKGMISGIDLQSIRITDDPDEVAEGIVRAYPSDKALENI